MVTYDELPTYCDSSGLTYLMISEEEKHIIHIKKSIRYFFSECKINEHFKPSIPFKYVSVIKEIEGNLMNLCKYYIFVKTQLYMIEDRHIKILLTLFYQLQHLEKIYNEYLRTKNDYYYNMLVILVYGDNEINIGGYAQEIKMLIQWCKKMFQHDDEMESFNQQNLDLAYEMGVK